MLIAVWILGILAGCALVAMAHRKIEIVKMLIEGFSLYFCYYVLISGILIWMDGYGIMKAAVITLILEVLLTAFYFFYNGSELPLLLTSVKKYIPLAIILVAAAFLSNTAKEGLYNTSQDEGLYQIRALYYIGGVYDNVLDFNEYYEIENEYEQRTYKLGVADLTGYYLEKDQGKEDAGAMEGVLHGVATFPALLALWGKMFGVSNMGGVLTMLFLLVIGNTWLASENLKYRKTTTVLLSIFMAVCPIVMWNSKNMLAEIGLALFISCMLVFFTENSKKHLAMFTAAPVLAACFYHVTISMLIPMIIVLYIMNYLYSKDRGYLKAMVLCLCGYACGYCMMAKTAHYYTMGNLEVLFKRSKELLNENNMVGIVWTIFAVGLVIAIVLGYSPLRNKINHDFKKMRHSSKGNKGFGIVMMVLEAGVAVMVIKSFISLARSDVRFMDSSFIGLWLATAFICLPAAFAAVIVLRRQFAKSRNAFTIYFAFLYVIFMYCTMVWLFITYYYYYARYLTPYIILVLLAAGGALDRITWKALMPVGIVCAGIVVFQSRLIYTERDLTYCDFYVLENLASCIGEDDAILLYDQGYHIQRLFGMQLKALTGADIYFLDEVNLDFQIEQYTAMYDNLFLLNYDTGVINEDSGEWRYVYKGNVNTSIYENNVDSGLPYARSAYQMESPVALMVYTGQENL